MKYLLAILLALIPSLAFGQADWGVKPDGGTLYFYTNTVGSDGVAETPASEAIAVYKDNSTAELTDGASIDDDFDAKVGLHLITIDTTQSGFDAGSMYTVVYTAGTVDAVSIVGRVIGTFSLGAVPANMVQVGGQTASAAGAVTFPGTLASTTNITNGTIALTSTGRDDLAERLLDIDGTEFGIGTLGYNIRTTLDATISSRMATYAQPTGFLAATFPGGTIANTTNITAGTIATTTADKQAAIELLYTFNSTNDYAGSVAGSFIKETVTNVASGSGLDAAGVRAAIGLNIANLDTQLTNIDNFVDGEIAQIISEIATSGVVMGTKVDQISTDAAAIKVKTDFLPSATAGSGGGVFIAGANAATSVNFTGNLSGAVGSVTGNVGGNVTGSIGSLTQTAIDLIYNEPTTGNQTAGTFGKAVTDASSAGNPWSALTADNQVAGSFGLALGAGGGGGLTAQQFVDGLKLAPSVGAAALGSPLELLQNIAASTIDVDDLGEAVATHVNLAQGGPVEQRKVPASRTIKLSRRSDGTYRAVSPIRMPAGETLAWALDLADVQLPAGDTLYGMVEPVSDDEDQATVASYGVQLSKVILVITTPSGATPGDTAIITANVSPTQGETLKASVIVNILNP